MSEKNITYAALGIAVVAIVIAAYSATDKPNLDGFASISQQQAALDRIAQLENIDHVNLATLDDRYASSNSVDKLLGLMVAETELLVKFQAKIVQNADDIKDNHPFNFEPEEFPVESEVEVFSSLLEIRIEKPEWIQGEVINFTGKALVNAGQVQATIIEPDGNPRYLNAVVHNDGTWNFPFPTSFDSQLGEYKISVTQQSRISQPVLFTIVTSE